jgi:hypothetical protein
MWEAVRVGVDHVSGQDGEGSPPYGAPHALRPVVLVLPLCTNKKTNEKTGKFQMSSIVDLELDPDPEPDLYGCRPSGFRIYPTFFYLKSVQISPFLILKWLIRC